MDEIETRLLRGDCLEQMDMLIAEGVEVDAIITDPPFGKTRNKWDSIIPLNLMWGCLGKIIKQDGVIALSSAQPFTSMLISSNQELFKYCWYWKKNRATGVLNAKRQPLRDIEEITVFNVKTYIPQGLIEVNQPSRNGKKDYNNYGIGTCKSYIQKYTNYPKQLLEFDSVQRTVHPTQKPVPLMEYLIKTYTNEGETVLDFTMGSGTTGVACANLDRSFIGIELDEKYFEIAAERIDLAIKELEY